MWLLLFGAPAALAVEGALFGERVHLLIGVVVALMVLATHLTVTGPQVRPREWLLTQFGLVLMAAAVALEVRLIPYPPGDELAWQRSQFQHDGAVVLCLVAAAACLGFGLRSSRPVLLLFAGLILGARGWAAIDTAWQSHRTLGYYEAMSKGAFLDIGVRYSSVTSGGLADADFAFAAVVAASLISPALLILSRFRRVP